MQTLSIIMPVYNEVESLERIFDLVASVDLSELGLEKQIVLVDDCSSDGTQAIMSKLEPRPGVCVAYHPVNRGKGAAIRTGLQRATGDIVLIQDADLEYDPHDYPDLVRPIVEGRAEVVYGSRIRGEREFGTKRHSYVSFYVGGRFLSWLTNTLYGTDITDEPTCYKVFRREVLEAIGPLECEGFEFCPEVTAKVALHGYRIYEVPIHYYPRTKDQGKKIQWRDGAVAIQTLLKYRLFRR